MGIFVLCRENWFFAGALVLPTKLEGAPAAGEKDAIVSQGIRAPAAEMRIPLQISRSHWPNSGSEDVHGLLADLPK
jgi:hypothetical protein